MLLFVLALGFHLSCGGQKAGELCQRNSDCESGTCTQGKCQNIGAAPAALERGEDDVNETEPDVVAEDPAVD
jgi:hypothetical protein